MLSETNQHKSSTDNKLEKLALAQSLPITNYVISL